MLFTRTLKACTAAVLTLGCAAMALGYPSQPIRVVVPFVSGGGTDVMARQVMERVGTVLGARILIENRPGGSGLTAADLVAKSAADGYTVLISNSSLVIHAASRSKLPFDMQTHLRPVTDLATVRSLLVVNGSSPLDTLGKLLAQARARPGHLVLTTSGIGQQSHMAGMLLQQKTGVSLKMVHYKGNAAALGDLMGGHVDMSFGTVAASIDHVRAGRLRALAVSGPRRLRALPDVPAIAETVPGFEVMTWLGLFVPAGTPKPIVEQLQAAVAQVLAEPNLRKRLEDEGASIGGSPPDQFATKVQSELVHWQATARSSAIGLD